MRKENAIIQRINFLTLTNVNKNFMTCLKPALHFKEAPSSTLFTHY